MRLFFPLIFLFLALWLSACSEDKSGPIDVRAAIPALESATVSPRRVNTDTIIVNGERKPTDVLTIPVSVEATVQGVATRVGVAIRRNENTDILATGNLSDTGVSSVLAVRRYAGEVNVQFPRSLIGMLDVSVWAENAHGDRGVTIITPVLIERLNQPPVVSALNAPDTVRTGSVNQFFISLRATDPDGAADIKSVFRITPSQKILLLNDAGINGDGVAGDGIYSETVSVNPAPSPGSYLFHFRAVDRSNDSSNVLSKTIVIVP